MYAFRRKFQLPYWECLRLKGFAPRDNHDSSVVSEIIRLYSFSMDYVKLFDDVEQTLDRLSQDRVKLALVSYSRRPAIEATLKKFNLSRYFKSNCVRHTIV
jgi:beta-phosphoglucomutase-like phosphatase (HAD superfamily)